MRRIILVVGVALAAQGCGRRDAGLYADPVNRATAPAQMGGGTPLYMGRWAISAKDCGARPWLLTRDHLSSPTGPQCDLVGPSPSPAGYSASSLCSIGDRERTPGRLVMTLTGPTAAAMTLSAGPFDPPVALVRCAR